MAELMISGSMRITGNIQISGAKNAALPLMAACLLTKEKVRLQNIPDITDVTNMKNQHKSFGVNVDRDGPALILNAANASSTFEPKINYNPTRGGFTVLGSLVARFGEAKVLLPGGCQIGQSSRPVDFHKDALMKMGAEEVHDNDNLTLSLKAKDGFLHGANIHFKNVSVGATEDIMMAACLAEGKTTITNAAVEPEVIDLVNMLRKMGANIQVEDQRNKITIHGQRKLLSGTTHTVIPDRIEAGSYAIAAAISGGQLLLKMDPSAKDMLSVVVKKLKDAGVKATWQRNGLLIQRSGKIRAVDIITGPYPEFPTDLLPQWVTFMTQAQEKHLKAQGKDLKAQENDLESQIEDTIYDNRFQHVRYLKEMGASIKKKSDKVYIVKGGAKLKGNRVKAEDLRGGFALILAGMAAEGTTVVKQIDHVLRGYENMKEKLAQCGAKFEQLPETPRGFYGQPPQ